MYKFNSIKARDIKQREENEKKIFEVIKEKWNITKLKKTSEFSAAFSLGVCECVVLVRGRFREIKGERKI